MIKALLFSCLVFFAAVAAMLAGNASAEDALIEYETDAFTDERKIFIKVFGDYAYSRMALVCYDQHRYFDLQPTKMYWALTFEEFEEMKRYSINDVVDMKIRFDDAQHEVVGTFYLGTKHITTPGRRVYRVYIVGLHYLHHPIRKLLDKLIASNKFIAKAEGSEILQFDLSAIRSKLVRFQEECRQLQEGVGDD